MASWQPPIPAGALYSKAARALGPALPLLAYCYDKVGRDGWLEIVLKEAALDMDEPYQNIKRWWQMLENGPFFAEIENHKRKGLRVRFKNVWIDWRILSVRKSNPFDDDQDDEVSEMIPNTAEVDAPVLKEQLRDNLGTTEVPEMVLNHNGNKVLIDQDSRELGDAQKARAPSPRKEPTPKPIREALAQECSIGKISTREQQLQLNQSSAQIWREQQKAGATIEQIATDIRYVAGYYRKNDWRGKKGDRVTPAIIRELWQAAMDARAKAPAYETVRATERPQIADAETRRRILEEARNGTAKRH